MSPSAVKSPASIASSSPAPLDDMTTSRVLTMDYLAAAGGVALVLSILMRDE